MLFPHLLKSRSLEGVPGSPGKSQQEGLEDQGTLKQLGLIPPELFYLFLGLLAFLLALPGLLATPSNDLF